ncbi:hypothetical protein ACP4OV_024863 [Aristida adscensionis]
MLGVSNDWVTTGLIVAGIVLVLLVFMGLSCKCRGDGGDEEKGNGNAGKDGHISMSSSDTCSSDD